MLTFLNYSEYLTQCTDVRTNSHMPPAKPYQWVCADCKRTLPDAMSYALSRDNEMLCYQCCTARDIRTMMHASRFTGYLSSDGRSFVTWPGETLGTVIDSRPCKLTRLSYTHDKRGYMSVRVRDVNGREWHGRGSAGIVITLRACKGK
jgi:hypothetical protein